MKAGEGEETKHLQEKDQEDKPVSKLLSERISKDSLGMKRMSRTYDMCRKEDRTEHICMEQSYCPVDR